MDFLFELMKFQGYFFVVMSLLLHMSRVRNKHGAMALFCDWMILWMFFIEQLWVRRF